MIEEDRITVITDLHTLENTEFEKKKLYVIDDENNIDRKLEAIIQKNWDCIFVVIRKEANLMAKKIKTTYEKCYKETFIGN